jgi:glycosyltransferase involved in cell wall biosynthesis
LSIEDEMQSRIRELKSKRVQIMDSFTNIEDLANFLAQADVLVLPLADFKTPYRGMSSKLYEYQAVGKPIICCSNGLPKTYIEETNSGIAINPGDYENLAKAILKLKQNPFLAKTYGENGRKEIETEISIEAIGSKMNEVFNDQLHYDN